MNTKTMTVRVNHRSVKHAILRHLMTLPGYREEIDWGGRYGDCSVGTTYYINDLEVASQGTDKTLRLVVKGGYVL